ncbi:MAG: lysophospholipid acyltransferase family protein [Nocardioidaceae bacterium]
MPDAEIIPIGGVAAPGRGSRTSPSAAARALAPGGTTAKVPPRGRRDSMRETGEEARARAEPLRAEPLRADDLADAVADAARDVFGETGWERRLAELLAFLRRRITGDYDIDEFGFDAEITERFVLAALRPVAEKWFRIEVHGVDNIPTEGGALVVSNHSGALPMDGLMTALVLHDHADRSLRMLGADLVFRMPFLGELARKGGATLAGNEDAERMLRRGDLVGVWPEGFKGIGKPFSERYKLQRFGRGGFVSAALRVGVPIIPCSVVGAEEIYPMVGNVPALARLLGVPYFPITPFFPWLGLLGLVPLPSKWLIEFGEPIRTDTYGDGAAEDPMLVFNVTDQVRETIQQSLHSLLTRRRGVFG